MAVAREATPVESAGRGSRCRSRSRRRPPDLPQLLITRGIEERGHILYRQGKIPGSFYTGRGNEAASVAVATAMRLDDVGAPLQRDMGVHVTRGTEPWRIFAQYMGKADGLAAGRDGNVHMADIHLGLIAMVSHLPALMPVAVGARWRSSCASEPRVAVAWSGDGAMARGDAHEAMNIAGVQQLPVVFIVDQNQYAYSTPNRLEFACDHLADRADAYGFEGVVVDGTDVLTVYREAHHAIEKARAGGGPTLLELVTLRMEGHAVHDDAFYVPRELLEAYSRKDPIERFRRWLKANELLDEAAEDEIALESQASAERGGQARRVRRASDRRCAVSKTGCTPIPTSSTHPTIDDEAPVTTTKTYLQAISDGLREEMRRDQRVFLLGEDIAVYGGAFKVTQGFLQEFGDEPRDRRAAVGDRDHRRVHRRGVDGDAAGV